MKRRHICSLMITALLTAALVCGCAGKTADNAAGTGAGEKGESAEAVAGGSGAEATGQGDAKEEAEDAYSPDTFDPGTVYTVSEHEKFYDYSDCDTFTQIVSKLGDGKAYANAAIGDTDVLLVAGGTYEWEPGLNAAIDAEIFIYTNGAPKYLGYLEAGGTAYPLALKDGFLYVGGNHFMNKYSIKDDELYLSEEAYVSYESDGKDTYYYRTGDSSFADYDAATASEHFDGLFAELEGIEIINFDVAGGASASGEIPEYEYPGPEAFYHVMYKYLIDEYGPQYPEAQVTIPCPVIIAEEDSDNSDIRVYANFWVLKYDLNGDVLENTSGGSYPGCMHLKIVADSPDGYEVTKMEVAKDGSDFESSAREIFGKYYDDLISSNADSEGRDKLRAQIIANYAAANNLSITAFKDYGWDPVELPEENIDSFYSQLD